MSGYRVIDLNIFYKEFYTERLGTWWDDKLTIDAYIYESDGNGVRKYETKHLAEQFPMEEYGSDWWIFRDEVDMPSRRIAKILGGIKIDQNFQEPQIVITDSSTM